MRNDARFIPGEQIGAVSHWSFGDVDTASLRAGALATAQQEAQDRARDEALRQEGFALGFSQGQAHAVVDADKKIQDYVEHQGQEVARHFLQLFTSVEDQLAQAQQVMARGVLELACELARQVVRQELSVNPNVLQPLIREALGLLVADNKSAVVRLNPLDMEVLQDVVQTEFAALSLTLIADPTVKPGGCLLCCAGTVVDGSLDVRWRRAVANLGLNLPWED